MGFMNMNEAAAKYASEPMRSNIKQLIEFDLFHCLLAGSVDTALEVKENYPGFPDDYIEWVKLCDGGILFDTTLFSTRSYDSRLKLHFETYDEFNDSETYLAYGIPEDYEVFGKYDYGPLLCFDVKSRDGKVYVWDYEFMKVSEEWDTFADWMKNAIENGIELIADEALEPLGIKMMEGS